MEYLKTVHILGITLVIIMPTYTYASFLEVPVTQNVAVGTSAMFRCQHPTADIIRWRVNGSLIGGNPFPDITRRTTNDQGGLVGTLTIVSRLGYNLTEVVCVARFDDGSPEENTETAMLIIHLDSSGFASSQNFTILPSDVIFPVMTSARFTCQHPDADIVTWRVNGTLLNKLPESLNIPTEGNGMFHSLIIQALSMYNGTTFECIATRINSNWLVSTPSVKLLIQGPLSAAQDIKRYPREASIRWTAPFSLNITNTEPDIIYNVEIFNITCGKRDLILGIHQVAEPNYSNKSILQKADLYEIRITPMNNVIGSLNGTSTTVKEKYIFINGSAITPFVRKVSGEAVDVQINLTLTDLGHRIAPDQFLVSLEPINGIGLQNFSSSAVIVTDRAVILIVKNIPCCDLLYCTIYASRCGGISVSETTLLSTFDFQNIDVVSSSGGVVLVSCGFIQGSKAAGVLVIAYSVTNPSNIYYAVIPRNGQDRIKGGLTCLSEGEYNVLLFVIKENGLPHCNPAELPLRRSVDANNPNTDQVKCSNEKQSVRHRIYHQGDEVCVECYDNCLVIVHTNITLLNSMEGLLNISSIHQLNAMVNENKTAYTCIMGSFDLGLDYQIAVIPWINARTNTLPPTSEGTKSESDVIIFASIGAAAGIIVIIIILVIVILGMYCYRKHRSNNNATKDSSNLPSTETHGQKVEMRQIDGMTKDPLSPQIDIHQNPTTHPKGTDSGYTTPSVSRASSIKETFRIRSKSLPTKASNSQRRTDGADVR